MDEHVDPYSEYSVCSNLSNGVENLSKEISLHLMLVVILTL